MYHSFLYATFLVKSYLQNVHTAKGLNYVLLVLVEHTRYLHFTVAHAHLSIWGPALCWINTQHSFSFRILLQTWHIFYFLSIIYILFIILLVVYYHTLFTMESVAKKFDLRSALSEYINSMLRINNKYYKIGVHFFSPTDSSLCMH